MPAPGKLWRLACPRIEREPRWVGNELEFRADVGAEARRTRRSSHERGVAIVNTLAANFSSQRRGYCPRAIGNMFEGKGRAGVRQRVDRNPSASSPNRRIHR